ncbi:MAG TPA: TRAP transporter small permease, partial [Geminicoccaceae bacterium]|nr:TRAP transporter small permease [Geminicoccaceae bacterium]
MPPRLEEALGAAALGLICVISFANVVVRYATNVSFAFTEEFSVFLLAFMTFVGASLAFARDGHIRIPFFVERLPPSLRRACGWVSLGVTVALLGLIAYYGALFTLDEWRYGETSP